jgi:hypothetical protein
MFTLAEVVSEFFQAMDSHWKHRANVFCCYILTLYVCLLVCIKMKTVDNETQQFLDENASGGLHWAFCVATLFVCLICMDPLRL